MTARAAARKSRQPSPAELKRQAAAHKNEAAQALQAVAEIGSVVKDIAGQMQAMSKEIQSLKSTPTPEQVLARHDPNHRMVNEVLGIDDLPSHLPEKPEVHLPDHLVRAARELERQREARNNPVNIRQSMETDERDIGQFEPREMRSEGPARESLSPLRSVDDDIVLDNKRYSKDKLDIELFMQELVCVRLADSTDDTQIPIPQSVNSGKIQYFVRGKIQWVKRLYLEPLARAKKTTYSQTLVTHDNGVQGYMQIPHTSLMYPFEVIEDTQKGRAWLARILAEPR